LIVNKREEIQQEVLPELIEPPQFKTLFYLISSEDIWAKALFPYSSKIVLKRQP